MTWDPTPWAIGGGARHSPEILRLIAHAATAGSTGVVLPTDCKVSALGNPGPSVAISAGSVVMPNRYTANSGQSYVGRNASTDIVSVPGTGGSSRSDLIVARVVDPQYEGQPPADPLSFNYMRAERIHGVPSGTTRVEQLGLGYPAFALARIDIPAGQSAVTASMIKDLRQVANPRTKRVLLTHYPTTANYMGPGETGGFTNWPLKDWQLVIPDWATVAHVRGTISGAEVSDADVDVQVAVLVGNIQGQASTTEWLTVVAANGTRTFMRGDIQAAATLDVSALRGQEHTVRFRSAITAGAGGRIRVDNYSTLVFDIDFEEAAV